MRDNDATEAVLPGKRRACENLLDLAVIAVGFLVVLPIFGLNRTTDFIIFCIFVLGFNLLYGYMGRLSFGHMLYLGTGAYAVTLFTEHVSQESFSRDSRGHLCRRPDRGDHRSDHRQDDRAPVLP